MDESFGGPARRDRCRWPASPESAAEPDCVGESALEASLRPTGAAGPIRCAPRGTPSGSYPAAFGSGAAALRRLAVRAADLALETLSPTRCAGCERAGFLLCEECLSAFALIDPSTSCIRCGAPFGAMLCTECAGELGACDRVLATAAFSGPVPRIVRAYKDAGERRLAEVIAELLLDTARNAEFRAPDRFGGILAPDAVAFVPATAEAYRRRGFDHMEAVARSFAGLAGAPVLDCIAKLGRSDQRKLGREGRLASSAGAYRVMADVRGARLLLLDDVITTGATMQAAAAALREAGAVRVDFLALARVW